MHHLNLSKNTLNMSAWTEFVFKVKIKKYEQNTVYLHLSKCHDGTFWVVSREVSTPKNKNKNMVIKFKHTHTLRWLLFLLAAFLPGSRSKENFEFKMLKSTPAESGAQIKK